MGEKQEYVILEILWIEESLQEAGKRRKRRGDKNRGIIFETKAVIIFYSSM
jgi:hypothetical protein